MLSRLGVIAMVVSALSMYPLVATAASAPACLNDVKAKADAIGSAANALKTALGPDANKAGSDGAVTSLYLNAAGACTLACGSAGSFAYSAHISMCQSASMAAGLADVANSVKTSDKGAAAGAIPREGCTGSITALTHAIGRAQQLASKHPSAQVRQAASNAVSALNAAKSSASSCTGDIAKANAALSTASGTQSPAQKFEAIVKGFHVLQESGQASVSAATATLSGKVSVWPTATPALKVTVKNANVTLTHSGGGMESSYQKGATIEALKAMKGKVGIEASKEWNTLSGSGTLELAAAGITVSIPGASFQTDSEGRLTLSGSDVSVEGCTHQVGSGSRLSGTRLRLVGSLKCGSHTMTSSMLYLKPGEIAGQGKLQVFNHAFDVTYGATAQHLTASGTWDAGSADWQALPGVSGVQYKVSTPKVKVEIAGASLSASVDAGTVEARTTALKPNNEPWAQAQIDPPSASISFDGKVSLRMPTLPQPPASQPTIMSGALCDARCSVLKNLGFSALIGSGTGISTGGQLKCNSEWQGECQISGGPFNGQCKAVTGCPGGQEKFADGGVWKCRLPVVQPPSVPSLPTTVTVNLSDIVR